ncbi:IX [Mastadenovirus porcusquartum]|uniref:IX n=1 Tax=Mastadenovirus porcusquartum TaxID=3241439 RepID=A0A5P9VI56_9ADEN|nr:IX [Porcine mastadenovirus B]QFX65718.1 IX [Porcine mastadenovirus B]
MESAVGRIHVEHPTVRLSPWAGVRQNVTGSDINGQPVQPSNCVSTVCTSLPEVLVNPVSAFEALELQQRHLRQRLEALLQTVQLLKTRLGEVENKVPVAEDREQENEQAAQ